MDKSWITKPRNTNEYKEGVKGFINFAFKHRAVNGKILCPCRECGFKKRRTWDVVYDHLRCTPFPVGYTCWSYHGEIENHNASGSNTQHATQSTTVEDPIQNMINDAFGIDGHCANEVLVASNVEFQRDEDVMQNTNLERNEANEFYELARDGEQPLYEGCTNYSRLSFLVKLYHIKCLCGMSDKAMTMILELLQDAFKNAKIPSSFYEAKKTITKLGLNYEKIHACPNHCMLYWGNTEDEARENCKVCHTSRWKSRKKPGGTEVNTDDNSMKKVPAKDDLRRSFGSSHTGQNEASPSRRTSR